MKTKKVKAFTLTNGDKLLIKMDATHSAVREITDIHPIKDRKSNLYSIQCTLGVHITCEGNKKQHKVISE